MYKSAQLNKGTRRQLKRTNAQSFEKKPTDNFPLGNPVAQLTKWRYDGAKWEFVSGSAMDADGFPKPDDYVTAEGIVPGVNDLYDRTTGEYLSFAKAHGAVDRRAKSKKRPKDFGDFFDADREPTPYGAFQPTEDDGKPNRGVQGPHFASHVLKRTVFDMAKRMGLDPLSMVGSKLVPPPRQALKIMIEMLKANRFKNYEKALKMWYNEYKTDYELAKSGGRGSKKALKRAIEAHPATTYAVGRKATPAEIAGKSESASIALRDLDTLFEADRSKGVPAGLTTVDSGYEAEDWEDEDHVRPDYLFNLAKVARGIPASPAMYEEAPASPKIMDEELEEIAEDEEEDEEDEEEEEEEV